MKKILLLVVFAMVAGWCVGQDAQLNKYKSLFTLNFVRYIGWPESQKQGDFVIGVLKNKELAAQLKMQTSGKKVGYQNIVVKEFKNVEEIVDCQIIYVSQYLNYKKHASAINSKIAGVGTLVITESEEATNSGSMINFVVRDEKLKFEVSESNATDSGLLFSNSLAALSNAISR